MLDIDINGLDINGLDINGVALYCTYMDVFSSSST